jgi:putative peptidoglycan lipid II flippase
MPMPRGDPALRRLLRLFGPGALGAGAVQIGLMVNLIIGSLLAQGSVSFLYYADRIVQLPLGVVGAAIATALLPALTRDLGRGEAAARHTLDRALEGALALTLPAMAGLALLAQPIIAVLFQRGAFDAAAAQATSAALAAFALGLPAYVLVKVLAPAFFAREDTRTPVRAAVIALGVNVALDLALMPALGAVGIALATAAAAWLNAALLARALVRRGAWAPDAALRRRTLGLLAAVALMAAVLWLARRQLDALVAGSTALAALALFGLIAGGAAVYAASAQLLGGIDAAALWRAVRGRPA